MDAILQDIRFGVRMLRKSPGATAVAILSLALGIGATTAIFTVLNAVLLRPLPYRDPASLVMLWEQNQKRNLAEFPASPPNFRDWTERSRSFSALAAVRAEPAVLTGVGEPERIQTARVSPVLFSMLGVAAVNGRVLAAEDGDPARSRVVVLSHGLWQRRWGGDAAVLGRTLTLDGIAYSIAGVAPRDFRLFDTPAEIWIPYIPDPKELAQRGIHTLKVMGRLAPGVTVGQARSEMASIANRLAAEYPDFNANWSVAVVPLREQLVAHLRQSLWILLVAVALVLLIACTNVAGILLMKAGARHRELAIRATLGASPGRIFTQLLAESLVLSMIAAIAGVLFAWWGTTVLERTGPAGMPQMRDLAMDWRVLLFALLLAIGTGVLFGLAPGLWAMRADLNAVLRAAGRSGMSGIAWGRVRGGLVIAELMLAQVLLIGAGLLVRSLFELEHVALGFRPDHVISMQISLPPARYDGLAVGRFYERLLERLEGIPGVQHAGLARDLPLSGGNTGANANPSMNFQIEGRPVLSSWEQPRSRIRAAGAEYFAALGIPLVRGRYFERGDSDRTPAVVVINQALARREWPGEDALGKRLRCGFDNSPWATIVGIVGDVRHAALDAGPDAEIYYHYLQFPPEVMPFVEGTMTLALRTGSDPVSIVSAVRQEVARLDRELALFNVRTVEDMVSGSSAQPRFRAWLLGLFAGAALLLAAIGLYGLLAYSVAQRSNELGIRMALGATTGDVLRLIVWQGLGLAASGIAAGLAAGFLLARVLEKMLFQVAPRDLVAFGLAPAILLVIAALASWLPALRAARVDPADALRDQ